MTTRRIFLGWLAKIGAAVAALPRSVFRASLRSRPSHSKRQGILLSHDDFTGTLAELADPNDPVSIRLLIDSVLIHDNTLFPPMPAEIEDHIKKKLVMSEIAYRQGRGPAVREQCLADVCNMIAAHFAQPEAALTSRLQVRVVRMQRSLSLPKLMQVESVDESVGSVMSPLQAAVVMKDLLVSKRGVPWYWVAPAELSPQNVGVSRAPVQEDLTLLFRPSAMWTVRHDLRRSPLRGDPDTPAPCQNRF